MEGLGNEAISRMSGEFERHSTKGAGVPFSASPETNELFARQTRDLEKKRQTRNLTATEKQSLSAVDDLMERIAKYNKNTNSPRLAASGGEQVYNLAASRLREQEGEKAEATAVRISQTDASNIIRGLNEQFEKKVLPKLHREEPYPGLASAREGERNLSGAPDGRNLEDYLVTLRGRVHSHPFADEDSHFDLSKFVAKQK